jgi:hypothetical protein
MAKALRVFESAFINAFGRNNNAEIFASIQMSEKRAK